MKSTNIIVSLFSLFLTLSATHHASAQAASTPTTPSESETAKKAKPPIAAATPATTSDDATVTLSPFTVSSDSDVGYLAGNTLAGSRMNTPLKDTAASLSILTAEFIKDLGANDLAEAMAYSNNSQIDLNDGGALGGNVNDNSVFTNFPGFRVRGVTATVARNYFAWRLPIENYNVERIEEARGPNSILFGVGAAGGIVSASTKQANVDRAFQDASLQASNYGSYRGTIDVNRGFKDQNFGVRVNGLYVHTGHFREHAKNDQKRVDVAAIYRPFKKTEIRLDYETGEIDEVLARTGFTAADGITFWLNANRPLIPAAVATNNALGLFNFGTDNRATYYSNSNSIFNNRNQVATSGNNLTITDENLSSRSVNFGGPGQKRRATFDAFSAFLTQQITDRTFAEVAYNSQNNFSRAFMAGYGNDDATLLRADPNQTTPTGAPNPYAGKIFIEGHWGRWQTKQKAENYRASLSHEHDFGKWGNYRIAGMVERDEQSTRSAVDREMWAGAPFGGTPQDRNNRVQRRSYAVEGDWSTYYVDGPATSGLIRNVTDPTSGRVLSSDWVLDSGSHNTNIINTVLVAAQMRYFKNRLVIGAGARQDKLDVMSRGLTRDPVSRLLYFDYTLPQTEQTARGKTKTIGGVYHLTKLVSVFYNISGNFALPRGSLRILPDDVVAPNPEGNGSDYGMAFTLLNDKLYVRLTRYEVKMVKNGDNRFGSTINNPSVVASKLDAALVSAGQMTQAEADARRFTSNGATFNRQSEGYEASITGNLTKGLRLSANYSYTAGFDSEVAPEVKAWAAVNVPFYLKFNQNLPVDAQTFGSVLSGFTTELTRQMGFEGVSLPGNRKHKMNVFARYSLPWEATKGLFVGIGYRHQSKNAIGRYSSGGLQYGNSYWLSDGVIGYSMKKLLFLKNPSIQLNVANLFNYNKPLITSRQIGGPFEDQIYRWSTVEERSWRLTLNTKF